MNTGTPSTTLPRASASRWLPALAAIFATGVFAIPATSHEPAQEPPEVAVVQPAAAPADRAQSRRRCDSCGRIQSIRRIEATAAAPASFEFTVRLYDGTVRTNSSVTAGNWHPGDLIILLGGIPLPGTTSREQT
jgi:hypothetical protein